MKLEEALSKILKVREHNCTLTHTYTLLEVSRGGEQRHQIPCLEIDGHRGRPKCFLGDTLQGPERVAKILLSVMCEGGQVDLVQKRAGDRSVSTHPAPFPADVERLLGHHMAAEGAHARIAMLGQAVASVVDGTSRGAVLLDSGLLRGCDVNEPGLGLVRRGENDIAGGRTA